MGPPPSGSQPRDEVIIGTVGISTYGEKMNQAWVHGMLPGHREGETRESPPGSRGWFWVQMVPGCWYHAEFVLPQDLAERFGYKPPDKELEYSSCGCNFGPAAVKECGCPGITPKVKVDLGKPPLGSAVVTIQQLTCPVLSVGGSFAGMLWAFQDP